MAVPPDLADPPDLRVDFEQIFNAHLTEIHRYIARRLSDDVADDLAAEVFLAAYRGGYDASRGAARPWLYGIATYLIARHRRTEIRRWKALTRTAERAEHSPEDAALARVAAGQLTGKLAGALAGLNRGDRDVVPPSAEPGHAANQSNSSGGAFDGGQPGVCGGEAGFHDHGDARAQCRLVAAAEGRSWPWRTRVRAPEPQARPL